MHSDKIQGGNIVSYLSYLQLDVSQVNKLIAVEKKRTVDLFLLTETVGYARCYQIRRVRLLGANLP